MKINVFGKSDIGLERTVNEDGYYIDSNKKAFFVCDGMGGHKAGNVASIFAIEIISKRRIFKKEYVDDQYKPETLYDDFGNNICNLIKIANYGVYACGYKNEDFKGMGSTFVGLFFNDNKAYIANVGDSRLYFISDQTIIQKTEDHSWVNEQFKKKLLSEKEIINHPLKNVITRALGQNHDIKVDLIIEDIMYGYYLLCSDGLSNLVENEDIYKIVIENKNNLEIACDILINKAKENGGHDNITVIIVECLKEEN